MTDLIHNSLLNWAFPGGVGLVIVSTIGWITKRMWPEKKDKTAPTTTKGLDKSQEPAVSNVVNVSYTSNAERESGKKMGNKDETPIEVRRGKTNILFIDDKKFDVVEILKGSGWINTTWIKDVKSLNQKEIINADIIFVDIQGVGISMRFSEEGLGLAKALKEKHKDKKIVIYSAVPEGHRFHEALRIVDDSLDKDSDPYVFEEIVERLSA